MSAHSAAELKSQGALEAARDPNSSVTAQEAENKALQEARNAGAPAFQFDPNASPGEKARQLKEAGAQRPHRKHQTAALVSDQDDGETAGYDLPPPSKEGAIAEPVPPTANGHAPEDDDWAKVGWAPRFGNPGDKDDGGTLLDHQTFLEGQLDEKFYGDWYHNAGIIIFACLSTYVVTLIGGGLGSVFIIMAVCGTYYRTSIRRVRRNFRDDVNRELAKARIETDAESLEWMNSFLVKFWPIYAPVICTTIVQSVDQVLSTSTPAFLDSMRLKSFTLGTKPPRLEHVKSYPRAEDDTVIMDWKFSFTPNDTADLTARQIKNKINPKVVLEIRIGKAMISKGMDIIVEDMACSGIMRVKLKLQLPFPHIDRAEICFMERPNFDYVCKPIGGDMLGFDINFIPGLEGFIKEQIHANLGPMMYNPNVFPIEVAKMLAGTAVDQAIGVLQVTFHGAQGLKNPDKFSGTPDPYATVSINGRELLGKTKTVHGNANPRWNETVNIIITSLREPLTLAVLDWNEYRKDKELGIATFNLEQLDKEPVHENLQLEVIASGRARGVVQADIRFFPVLEGHKLEDGTVESPPESMTGIAKFTVEQAKDLDGSKSMIGQLNPYAVLLLNGKEVKISQKLKRTNNPVWSDATKELLITDRKKAKLGLVIKDDRDLGADPVIGTYQIKLDDLLDLTQKGQEWYNLAGAKTGRAKMMLQWKPVALKGEAGGSGGYVTPIGVMRFHFQSGRELKNLDTVGKSDPYCRVLLSGIQKARTVTWKNNLNPDFDEVFYVPVHSTREKLVVEVMDEENTGADRTMGQFEMAASEYVQQGDDGEYLIHDTKDKLISAPLRIGTHPPRGTLNFTAAFYPTYHVVDPEEEEKAEDKSEPAALTNGHAQSDGTPKTPTSPAQAQAPAHTRSATAGTISSPASTGSGNAAEHEMQKALAAGEQEQTEADEVKKVAVPKIRIGPEDLAKYESGLVIFKILEAQLAEKNVFLEVVMDDYLFPSYTSAKARSTTYTFNETGDTMVRELDLSRITLRLVSKVEKKGDEKEDEVVAKVTGPTLDTLKRCLYTPQQITLKDKEGRDSKVTVSMRYLPVKMQLDPSESFNNSGTLRVDVLDATDLPAADRNGYSDPYCRFNLNGKEVYKTKTQKKTLHPAWNEFFEVPVRSRTAAKFDVHVMDWDFGDKADFLGGASINLDMLQPFQSQEVVLGLDGKSGTVRLKMVFKPDYVVRSRQGSSTFSGTFAAPGKVIGAPVKGVGKGAVLVGGGVAKGASFLGRGFKRRTNSGMVPETPVEDSAPNSSEVVRDAHSNAVAAPVLGDGFGSPPQSSSGFASTPSTPHHRDTSTASSSLTPNQRPADEVGTATITVVSASGFGEDNKIAVHIVHDTGSTHKEVLKTDHPKPKDGIVHYRDETKKVQCTADTAFKVKVMHHKTFGSDPLGEAPFYITDSASGSEKNLSVGDGTVVISSSFVPADGGSAGSPQRLRLGGFRSRRDRSVTPSAA
ncbi:tricalbin [Teratosphaeria nubilosa]|uniref:Tricalbin n=1 Tax=Teratosphaeria nubilosa TaxID=161662 RepID=A0A6G1L1K9_9PEZI|nr:tricalbin [Teratosphaeria nubilosa]